MEKSAPLHVLKLIVYTVFVLWLLGHLTWQVVLSLQHFARGEAHTVATYGLFYGVILGGITLWLREPLAAAMRQSRVPDSVWYLGVGLLYVIVEEVTCFLTNSGIWGDPAAQGIAYPLLLVGIAVLFGWVLGSYFVARYLKLGRAEIFVLTTSAGWFMEVAVSRSALFTEPHIAFAWLPWAMYTYGLFIIIPLLVIPGPAPVLASGGRWWRYPLAFILPLVGMVAIGAPAFALSGQ